MAIAGGDPNYHLGFSALDLPPCGVLASLLPGAKAHNHGPAAAGGAAQSGAEWPPEAIENRDAMATHRGRQDLGGITSQKWWPKAIKSRGCTSSPG